jgi:hypothetical protein
LSFTEAAIVTVPVEVGVPAIDSVFPPVLVAVRPLVKLIAVPFVGTATVFTVHVYGAAPPVALIAPE